MNAPILKSIHFAIETQQRQICRESAAAYIDTNFVIIFLNLGNPYKPKTGTGETQKQTIHDDRNCIAIVIRNTNGFTAVSRKCTNSM